MNKRIYEKTKYPGIWRHIKNKNYIVDICYKSIRTSISTLDGTRGGAKIYDIKVAKRIQDDPNIIKKVTLSISNKDTVEMAFNAYINDLKYNQNLVENTIRQKESIYKTYLSQYKKRKLTNINKDDIMAIKIEIDKRCSKNSAKYTAFKTVKSFFNWLVNQKIISESPAKEIRQFKKTKIIHTIWTPTQVNAFRETVKSDFNSEDTRQAYKARMIHLIINLDYALSGRIGETRGLQYKKINFETGKIIISAIADKSGNIIERTKTDDSTDTLIVPEQIMNEIKEYKQWIEKHMDIDITDDTPLFFSPDHPTKSYTPSVIRDTYKKYCNQCEEELPDMPIYNFRHSGVALMQDLGYEMYVIQARVRHKNIETTIDTYGSISEKTKRKLVEDISRFF